MPTEHEFKYVLSSDFLTSYVFNGCDQIKHIKQGYLTIENGFNVRIRQETYPDVYGDVPDWFLTLKKRVNDRVIEIENKLESRDAMELWFGCKNKIKKIRHIFNFNDFIWEVDVFYDKTNPYLTMAEVELPEGSDRIKTPHELDPFIVHEVELNDDRFSNTKLGDVKYVKKLISKIHKKT